MSYVNAPIHDLLIRIKNAYMARKSTVEGVVFSNFKVKILDLIKEYGFITGYNVIENTSNKKTIDISLKTVRNPVNDIPNIKFFSRPSRPWYVSYKDIRPIAGGKGIGILSTNQGLMASHTARQKKLGGELIAEIY